MSSFASRACRPAVGAVLLLALAAPPARADSLPPDKLKAVKEATVLVRVVLPNGQAVSGSGFFAHAPGLVVTNAHVLGMLDPDSRRPRKVEVVVRSGEPDSKALAAEVLGVDRGTDLGVVRVTGDGLPAPLKPETADRLTETEEVFAFGFPFGERLGKNITVAKTSVSSLRKTPLGRLDRIQVNGGIHPGNSGGPVVDLKGRVVGISVSGLRNTQIQFAIPADRLTQYLAGRISSVRHELPYRSGGKVLMPVRVEALDPLGRLKKVQIEYFTAPNGPPRNAGDKKPDPRPGDSGVKVYDLAYDPKLGVATCEVELADLPGPTHRNYVRPVITDGNGRTRWYGVAGEGPKYVMDRVPQVLAFNPDPAAVTPAEVVSIGSFRLRTPDDEELALGLNLKTRFRERAGAPDRKTYPVRIEPMLFAFAVTKDGKPTPTNADRKEIARDFPRFSADVVREEDGNWVRATGDASRVPPASRAAASDLGGQLLQSLEAVAVPLPNREVKPLESWKSRREVVVGASSLDLTMTGIGDYRYTYLGMTERAGKKIAFLRVEGTIRGKVGAGLDVGGTISGRADIDPATGETIYSELTLKADADLTTARKETLKVLGTLTVQLRRGNLPPLGPPKK